jgi:hypothetical protein
MVTPVVGEGRADGASLRHRHAHANQAQLTLSGIAHDREDFYYDEAFSCAEREFLSSK